MNIEKQLKDIRFVDNRINTKLRQVEILRSQIGTVKSFDYSKDRVQESNRTGSSVEDIVANIYDLELEITRDIDLLVQKKNEASQLINRADGTAGTVLEMRYLENMAWRDIANTLNLSKQRVFQLHDGAMKYLKIIKD